MSSGNTPMNTNGASGPCCMLCGSTRTSSGQMNIISPATDTSASTAADLGPTRTAWSARPQSRFTAPPPQIPSTSEDPGNALPRADPLSSRRLG
ncbi:hypothetical protein Aglo01_33900 [Actinokineospora globicatena]|nr:hypothetical protein Aglo01_33900 [Actinokineospora globicatena]